MQVPVLGCTFLTLVRSAGIGTDHQGTDDHALMIVPSSATHKLRPPVPSSAPTLAPPTCAQQITHLCPAVYPPVPSSAPTCATLQCHTHVP
ncbi:unnamed protein product, partial [Staurois parvus]